MPFFLFYFSLRSCGNGGSHIAVLRLALPSVISKPFDWFLSCLVENVRTEVWVSWVSLTSEKMLWVLLGGSCPWGHVQLWAGCTLATPVSSGCVLGTARGWACWRQTVVMWLHSLQGTAVVWPQERPALDYCETRISKPLLAKSFCFLMSIKAHTACCIPRFLLSHACPRLKSGLPSLCAQHLVCHVCG